MVHLLKQRHKLVAGSFYTYKPKGSKGDSNKLWEFVSLDDTGVVFKHTPLLGPVETLELDHEGLKKVKKFDKKPPQSLEPCDQAKLDPLISKQLKTEGLKAEAQIALWKHYQEQLGLIVFACVNLFWHNLGFHFLIST